MFDEWLLVVILQLSSKLSEIDLTQIIDVTNYFLFFLIDFWQPMQGLSFL